VNPFTNILLFIFYVSECSLATFKNGAKTQKVPFVFLPMKGQIIHPSSDIIFSGKLLY
jgi:hypothetical protein